MSEEARHEVAILRPLPRIIPRSEHNISRAQISENALKVLYRLRNAGFQSFLVGGSVRDLLLGREPKDFDVVTNALPEQVRELFRNSRLIGRRFRLAHVRYGDEIIEVSTFRAAHHVADSEGEGHIVDGRIVRDNVYGTLDDDVWRRDLTVNALYYNIEDFSVIDYVGGLQDIKAGQIRLIGEPRTRYIEDPVRLLRVVRFAVKLGFRIEPGTEDPIEDLSGMLEKIPPARLFEEVLKMFLGGYALQTFEMLRHYDLFAHLFPQTEATLAEEEGGFPHTVLIRALQDADIRLAEGKPVTPAFLLAALLWHPMQNLARENLAAGLEEQEAIDLASDVVISRQIASTAVPRRLTCIAREIWQMQPRLTRAPKRQPGRLLSHPRFRSAYDFLLLRAAAGEEVGEAAEWWTRMQAANEQPEPAPPAGPRKRRRPRRRRKPGAPSSKS
ncbi:MAG TPA: polynucleotide adenylyltransferase PcnB [Gammaproteobacteria bacterium]|nr:polynucleotide adenylyltransferase PcnB [Gammaproteobacteria bacterium]